jgi:hypothetical protein
MENMLFHVVCWLLQLSANVLWCVFEKKKTNKINQGGVAPMIATIIASRTLMHKKNSIAKQLRNIKQARFTAAEKEFLLDTILEEIQEAFDCSITVTRKER